MRCDASRICGSQLPRMLSKILSGSAKPQQLDTALKASFRSKNAANLEDEIEFVPFRIHCMESWLV